MAVEKDVYRLMPNADSTKVDTGWDVSLALGDFQVAVLDRKLYAKTYKRLER
jgi:hypothetical protein